MNQSAVTIKDERRSAPDRRAVPQSGCGETPSLTDDVEFTLADRLGARRDSEELAAVLEMLPARIAHAARRSAICCGGVVSEIRLRRGASASVTAGGRNLVLPVTATDAEIASALRALCDRSLYAKSATICDGFIASRGGVRVGVCGRAVVRDGQIVSVAEISSLNIRIPHRVIGCADRLWELMKKQGFRRGVLVWSAPGVGKTTLLRELGVRLSTGPDALRTAIVDSRAELAVGGSGIADVLSLYPRQRGIEIAKRTLTPQVVICDEIATEEDVSALLEAHHAGVTVCASAHASSYASLMASPQMAMLRERGVFGTYYGLLAQRPGGYETVVRTVGVDRAGSDVAGEGAYFPQSAGSDGEGEDAYSSHDEGSDDAGAWSSSAENAGAIER